MRLSEERIRALSGEIIERLRDHDVIKMKPGAAPKVRTEIERSLISDQRIYDEIRRESEEFVKRSRNAPPEGSAAFETAVTRQMETLARKRNYVM
jgi:hypothetical protein